MPATIQQLESDLYLIGLMPPIPGFSDFIGSWLWKGEHGTCLVDVGPAVTVDQLMDALSLLDVDHLDYICLTHIHLDHAGGAGHLCQHFPEAPVVCHPNGIAHLIDPDRLWRSAVKTLGAVGKAYDPPLPMHPSVFATSEQLNAAPFQLIDTPGHAPHHFSIVTDKYLFSGEAAGVCLPVDAQTFFLRPSTPPRFFLEETLSSIDRILAKKPEILCYGHFGMRRDAMGMLTRYREQLLRWERIIAAETHGKPMADVYDWNRWVDVMLEKDPLFKAFFAFDPAVQYREREFLANSIRGFSGYLAEKATF